MATVKPREGKPPIPRREEREAVYLGVERVFRPRPEDEKWTFAVSAEAEGAGYVFEFECNGTAFGPGLRLSATDLHGGTALPGREQVTQAVQEDVALYVQYNLAE